MSVCVPSVVFQQFCAKKILPLKTLVKTHFFDVVFFQLNGTNVNLPVNPTTGVSVFKSGKHYTVFMDFGVTVRYDGNHFMDIKVVKE